MTNPATTRPAAAVSRRDFLRTGAAAAALGPAALFPAGRLAAPPRPARCRPRDRAAARSRTPPSPRPCATRAVRNGMAHSERFWDEHLKRLEKRLTKRDG